MPVYRVIDELTYEEMLGWYAYFKVRPPGWREDDRTAKLLQAAGVKAKAWELFPSLKAIYKGPEPSVEGSNVTGLTGSFLYQQMLSAKGGDKIAP
jgi:hypothetical protein